MSCLVTEKIIKKWLLKICSEDRHIQNGTKNLKNFITAFFSICNLRKRAQQIIISVVRTIYTRHCYREFWVGDAVLCC